MAGLCVYNLDEFFKLAARLDEEEREAARDHPPLYNEIGDILCTSCYDRDRSCLHYLVRRRLEGHYGGDHYGYDKICNENPRCPNKFRNNRNARSIRRSSIIAGQGIEIDGSLSVLAIDLYSVSDICKYVMEVITKDRLEFPLPVTIKFDGDSDGVLLGIAELCKLFPRYRDLQSFKKQETAERQGNELVQASCRTDHSLSPSGESLEMCALRAVAVLREHIEPQLQTGKNLLVTAHANSLMSIITYLDKPTAEEVIDLGMLTGILMLYIYEEGKFFRKGSLVGPTETGVYAYTKMLTLSIGGSWMRCQIDGQ